MLTGWLELKNKANKASLEKTDKTSFQNDVDLLIAVRNAFSHNQYPMRNRIAFANINPFSLSSANTSEEPIWNWNPFVAISSVFSPFGIFLIAFVCGMVFLFSGRARELLAGEKTDKDQRGFEILHDGLHGTSGWMTKEEQTHTLQVGKAESLSGTLIGKMDAEGSGRIAAVSDQLYMSGHVIVYGASILAAQGVVRANRSGGVLPGKGGLDP